MIIVKLMRKFILLSMTAVLLSSIALFAFCSLNDNHASEIVSQPTVERIQERGTLLVGTTGDYRPLSFLEADGTYWGFGIEVAGEIARRLSVGLQFVPTSWPTLSADVQAESLCSLILHYSAFIQHISHLFPVTFYL